CVIKTYFFGVVCIRTLIAKYVPSLCHKDIFFVLCVFLFTFIFCGVTLPSAGHLLRCAQTNGGI
ncbi:MAG: hypothetical protein ACK56I_05210, partial [bacterium]